MVWIQYSTITALADSILNNDGDWSKTPVQTTNNNTIYRHSSTQSKCPPDIFPSSNTQSKLLHEGLLGRLNESSWGSFGTVVSQVTINFWYSTILRAKALIGSTDGDPVNIWYSTTGKWYQAKMRSAFDTQQQFCKWCQAKTQSSFDTQQACERCERKHWLDPLDT